jgi:tripeptide aminopeptidase
VRKRAGRGSVNLGTIRGGVARNVVAPEAELILGVRSHCPGFRRTIVEQIRGAFRGAAATTRNAAGLAASVEFHEALDYEAFRLPADDPVVKAALAAARRAGGQKQQRVILDGGLDANWLTHHGVPTVTLSTGAADGHTVHDSLNVPAFVQRCDLALQLATGG